MAGARNVRKTQDRQSVEVAAHTARAGRTLPDRPKTQIKTTDRQSRTLRPFIWPSVGRFLLSSPDRPSFFPEMRCATPACEIAPGSFNAANGRGREHCIAKESAR
jgi:hypothetical protein